VIRRKHLALNTEQSYCAWLRRYCQHIAMLPADMPSEQKLEHILTALSKTTITASTQNQALMPLSSRGNGEVSGLWRRSEPHTVGHYSVNSRES
jgi:hypothetical protein